VLEIRTGRSTPHLFPYLEGRHREQRVCDFRKAWTEACLEATLDLEGLDGTARTKRKAESLQAEANGEKPGLLKMLRHDFRRTAVRNIVNRRARAGGHEDHRAQDPSRLRPLPYRQPG
jgi:hypothetical protein